MLQWHLLSKTATSSSITHCLRYESSIEGSYSSKKWLYKARHKDYININIETELNTCTNWIVKADFPTTPSPTTTSLYSIRSLLTGMATGPSKWDYDENRLSLDIYDSI